MVLQITTLIHQQEVGLSDLVIVLNVLLNIYKHKAQVNILNPICRAARKRTALNQEIHLHLVNGALRSIP